jgi:glycosyltransferase involved in cell wall biosynthesis
MHAAHILRKYHPKEWGGTETAVLRLLSGLNTHEVSSTVFCPAINDTPEIDPIANTATDVKRFSYFLPVLGLSKAQREQLIAWGGNLMSFDLMKKLFIEPELDVIHTHALNRLAGVSMLVAKFRKLPLVATIHGGVLDLPTQVANQLAAPLKGGFEWGKALGLLVRSRYVLQQADAVLTCNPREAELLRAKYPQQRVIVQPHSVPAADYAVDHRANALAAFPSIKNRDVILSVARIDPTKNQSWLVEQLPAIVSRHPKALLVLAGPVTEFAYGDVLLKCIQAQGLQNHVLLTGGLEPGGSELIGLMQAAKAMLLPSTSETFGLVILEAWAAGTPILSSKTSGALSLINHGENGWLFDLSDPASFHQSLDEALENKALRQNMTATANELVLSTYDVSAMGAQVRDLYAELIDLKRQRSAPSFQSKAVLNERRAV